MPTTALPPASWACCAISSNASRRVSSQSSVQSVMLPPKRLCSPAPIVPTIERDRTMIPRTMPTLRTIR
jgi:hypothetical protein